MSQNQIQIPRSQINLREPRIEVNFRVHNQEPMYIVIRDSTTFPEVEIVLFPRLRYREFIVWCHKEEDGIDYCGEETRYEIEFDSRKYLEYLNEEWVRGEDGLSRRVVWEFWREVAERIENLDEVIEKTERILKQVGLLKMIERFLP